MKNFGKKAFTLVELLLVITLIGILIGALSKVITGSLARARDAQRMTDINLIADFLTEKYLYTGKTLPTNSTPACLPPPSSVPGALTTAIEDNLPYFGGRFPADPKPNSCWTIGGVQRCCGQYLYYSSIAPNGSTRICTLDSKPVDYPFLIMAQMENRDKGNLATNLMGYALMRCGPTTTIKFSSSGPIFGILGSR